MLLKYRKLAVSLYYCPKTKVFYGEILNTENCITFQATTRRRAIEAMRMAVDAYYGNSYANKGKDIS